MIVKKSRIAPLSAIVVVVVVVVAAVVIMMMMMTMVIMVMMMMMMMMMMMIFIKIPVSLLSKSTFIEHHVNNASGIRQQLCSIWTTLCQVRLW